LALPRLRGSKLNNPSRAVDGQRGDSPVAAFGGKLVWGTKRSRVHVFTARPMLSMAYSPSSVHLKTSRRSYISRSSSRSHRFERFFGVQTVQRPCLQSRILKSRCSVDLPS
jgi:hypothetical protein